MRCLWNARERESLPVLYLSGRARTAHCGSENGSRRKNAIAGSKEGGWVYTKNDSASEMEVPDNDVPIHACSQRRP